MTTRPSSHGGRYGVDIRPSAGRPATEVKAAADRALTIAAALARQQLAGLNKATFLDEHDEPIAPKATTLVAGIPDRKEKLSPAFVARFIQEEIYS